MRRSRHQTGATYSRLKKIIATLLLGIGLGPAVAGLAMSYTESRREMTESTGHHFKEVSAFAAREIEVSLRDKISLTMWLAQLPSVRNLLAIPARSAPAEIATLRKIVMPEFASRYSLINVYRPDGAPVFTSAIVGERPSPLSLPADFASRGRAYVEIVPARERDDTGFMLEIFAPVLDDEGEYLGFIRSAGSVDHLFDRIRGLTMGETGHHNLVDSDADILFCSLYRLTGHTVAPGLVARIGAEETGWFRADDQTHQFEKAIIGFATVALDDLRTHPDSYGRKKWYVMTTQDPDETNAPLGDYRVVVAGYGLFLSALVLLVGFIGYRMILKAQRTYEGELVSRIKAESIGQLLQSYHQISVASLTECEALLAEREAEGVDQTASRRIRKIRRGIATVGSALDHLSYFAGTASLTVTSVNLRALAAETVAMLDYLFASRGLEVVMDDGDGPVAVSGDERLLRLVILNLLIDAAQAPAPLPGRIEIVVGDDRQGHARIGVTDHGQGRDPAQEAELFDPFHAIGKGTHQPGIGLAAILGIVEAHKGEIAVRSVPGTGRQITILLPLSTTDHHREKVAADGSGEGS
ncbi:MAG: hypothetical protein HQK87_01255 [Nitrospinae bacterium]|nr:hypothetical protein [Nitrospinota bacterium]